MKIISSSPYATFNSKEWNSLSRTNCKFSNTPIRVQKKYPRAFKMIESTEEVIERNIELPKQIQLAFA